MKTYQVKSAAVYGDLIDDCYVMMIMPMIIMVIIYQLLIMNLLPN